jgi:hypothetical protein
MSKFDEQFAEPVGFNGSEYYGVSAVAYDREQAAAQFSEYHGYTVEPDELNKSWVKWHGGIDDDGEMRNSWWESPSYEGKKRAKPVWLVGWDKHRARYGHTRSDECGDNYYTCERPEVSVETS